MPDPGAFGAGLDGAPTFTQALGTADRRAFATVGTTRQYGAGEALLLQGQRLDRVLVVLHGRVKVVSTAVDGTEVMLGLRGPGELLGEVAAVEEAEVGASALALEPVSVQQIPTAEFRRFLDRSPGAALALVRVLTGRLREADRQRLRYAATTALERLAAALLTLAGRYGEPAANPPGAVRIGLRLTRAELATMVAASPESVDRALRTLRAGGLLERDRGHRLVVLDTAALRRIAGEDHPLV
jgi:CRP-like cAMP-binding protein